jgi:hypothetical protein
MVHLTYALYAFGIKAPEPGSSRRLVVDVLSELRLVRVQNKRLLV